MIINMVNGLFFTLSDMGKEKKVCSDLHNFSVSLQHNLDTTHA